MNSRIEQLKQLKCLTWDGNLASKADRDELVKSGLAQRIEGWNWLTAKGVVYLNDLDLLDTQASNDSSSATTRTH